MKLDDSERHLSPENRVAPHDAPATADLADAENPRHDLRTRLRSFAYTSDKTKNTEDVKKRKKKAAASGSNTKPHRSSNSETEMEKENIEPSKPLRKSGRKRSSAELVDDSFNSKPSSTKKRSTTKERSAADPHNPDNNLVDSLRPGLMLVFIGLNPGLMTAATGHAYSHPSNLFWKLLNWSGVTPRRHHPSETHDLMDLYSIGNTNICARPTRSGDGLSKEELAAGAGILEDKIAEYKPKAVCIVGKGIWDTIYKAKTGKALKSPDFHYGWQDENLWLGKKLDENGDVEWAGSRTFVATTTSGLAASMKPAEKLEIWKPLGAWLQEQRNGLVKKEEEEEDSKVKEEE